MSDTPPKMLRDVDGSLWVSFGDYACATHKIEKQQARIAELEGRECHWVWKGNGWVAECDKYVLQTHKAKFCSSCGGKVAALREGEG